MAACSPSQRLRQNRNRIHIQAHFAGYLAVVQASRGRQNDSASPGQLLGGAISAHQGFQSLLLFRG